MASRTLTALALGVALSFAGVAQLGAQSQGPSAPPFQGTSAEMEAYRLYKDNRLISARARAQAVLDVDPDSIVGNYVMGVVMHEAEGILPRAMYHLGHARQVYEQRYGNNAPPGAPWQLHREILFATQALANEMEEYEFQLQILDYYNAIYDPDLTAERAWPLAHLGRFDEARAAARAAMASGDGWQQQLGRNALCAIEGEAHQREPAYRACMDALEDARRRAASNPATDPVNGPHVAVHAYNAAHAAYSVLRFDEVERLAQEGTHRLEFTIANPWRVLERLYVDEGKMGDAINAAREMQGWRLRQPASLRDQDRAETDVALATLMLMAGESHAGIRLIDRAIERPDRRGLVSSKPEQALGAHALLRRSLLKLRAEQIAEEASWSGTVQRASGNVRAAATSASTFADDQRIASVLTEGDRLDATFRVYLGGGIEPLSVWMLGDLVDVLGAGVVGAVLEQVRQEERATPAMTAYYDALEAEVKLAQGDEATALSLAQRALNTLPPQEAVLAARVAAVGAEAARRDGNLGAAFSLFERAMQKDPGILRRMGLALPARVIAGGNDAAVDRAATLLGRSPRFRESEQGFQVGITREGNALAACLRSPAGAMISCTRVTAERGETPENWAARLSEAFHRETFVIRGADATTDLHSLDGSTTVSREAVARQMQGLMGENPDADRTDPMP